MVTGIAPCAGFPSKQYKRHGSVSNKLVPSLKFLLSQTYLDHLAKLFKLLIS